MRRGLAVAATVLVVLTAGCVGILGGGGGGGDASPAVAVEAESVDGGTVLSLTAGSELPTGTSITVTATDGERERSQVLTLGQSVDGDTVYVGGEELTASVGSRPGPASSRGECDVTVTVDRGDRTLTDRVNGTGCLGLLATGVEIAVDTEPVGDGSGARYLYLEPTAGTSLPEGTTVNVALVLTVEGQTDRQNFEATLDRGVESGTRVYLGSGQSGDFGTTVGETPAPASAVPPPAGLPGAVEALVSVDTGENSAEGSLVLATAEEAAGGDDGSEDGG